VDSRKLSVKPEAGVSDTDQAEVQAKVLESAGIPEIVFRSTQVRPNRDNAWKLSGELTLHGVTRSVTIDVAREGGAFVGTVRIKQTDFGIQSIKIGGGVVEGQGRTRNCLSRLRAGNRSTSFLRMFRSRSSTSIPTVRSGVLV
jgi:hypothetical protein